MGDFRSRLFDEHSELHLKMTKLKDFILSDKFELLQDIDKKDLREQLKHMEGYFSVIDRRVSRQCN